MVQEVIVTVARAALGAKVFIDAHTPGGPTERVRALALPAAPEATERAYRALLPPSWVGKDRFYVPLVVADGQEIRGEPLRPPDGTASVVAPSTDGAMAFPAMEFIAHVEARLTNITKFGATPDGVQFAYYITEGTWIGPRIRAFYRAEGGDWITVRRDGVAIPNARATLEADDGALLYYQLTGTIDLGANGYARVLANDLPNVASLSVVAKVATSSERFSWLNRLTLVGAGLVKLTTGTVVYDIYSIACDPLALKA